jgi:hypothetical protein
MDENLIVGRTKHALREVEGRQRVRQYIEKRQTLRHGGLVRPTTEKESAPQIKRGRSQQEENNAIVRNRHF